MAALIDLLHLGRPFVIGTYLLPGEELAIIDCGPTVCVDTLVAGLAANGLALDDVRHLLLTHIHLDHAGGAGALVARHPGLQVHVHSIGAPHLVDPQRLESSARRLYGDELDVLFGPVVPVPVANVHVLGAEILGLAVLPTPGHASHHVAFLDDDGVCYAGDALGCLIPPGDFLYPACAPPEVDVPAWEVSFDLLEEREPVVFRLPHFGEVSETTTLVERARERLREWAGWVESGWSEEQFVAAADAELQTEGGEAIPAYRHFPSFALSYAGLKRYFDKRAAVAADQQGG